MGWFILTLFFGRSVSVSFLRPCERPTLTALPSGVRTVREECLNHLLIFNENHLRRVLTTFIELLQHGPAPPGC